MPRSQCSVQSPPAPPRKAWGVLSRALELQALTQGSQAELITGDAKGRTRAITVSMYRLNSDLLVSSLVAFQDAGRLSPHLPPAIGKLEKLGRPGESVREPTQQRPTLMKACNIPELHSPFWPCSSIWLFWPKFTKIHHQQIWMPKIKTNKQEKKKREESYNYIFRTLENYISIEQEKCYF